MAIRITREQRDMIYEEILTEISSGDVCVEKGSGNYALRGTLPQFRDYVLPLSEPEFDDVNGHGGGVRSLSRRQ
jgi:hypothetical protein